VSELTNVPAGEVTITEEGSAVDAPEVPSTPKDLQLRARQTPAVGSVVFDVAGGEAVPSTVEIFDSAGRRVFVQNFASTPAIIHWDGRGTSGKRVANGIYYARLRDPKREARSKVVIIRE
jgi:hypothetical protein